MEIGPRELAPSRSTHVMSRKASWGQLLDQVPTVSRGEMHTTARTPWGGDRDRTRSLEVGKLFYRFYRVQSDQGEGHAHLFSELVDLEETHHAKLQHRQHRSVTDM